MRRFLLAAAFLLVGAPARAQRLVPLPSVPLTPNLGAAVLPRVAVPTASALPSALPSVAPAPAARLFSAAPAPSVRAEPVSVPASALGADFAGAHPAGTRQDPAAPAEGRTAAASAAGTAREEDGLRAGPVEQGALRPSRPGFDSPHEHEPTAVLPDGREIPPDSYGGGYHGTDRISPEQLLREGGMPARAQVEDWSLLDHVSQDRDHVSAFRGTTQMVSSPDGSVGAALWADEGGWVYELRGVPTWDVNGDLDGRVRRADGTYRGNRVSGEAESAVPAQVPLECIPRWGRVESNSMGIAYVPTRNWVSNPRFDPVRCLQFWGGR